MKTPRSTSQASPYMSPASLNFRMVGRVTSAGTDSCLLGRCHVRVGIFPYIITVLQPLFLLVYMLKWHSFTFVTVVSNPLCSLSCNVFPDHKELYNSTVSTVTSSLSSYFTKGLLGLRFWIPSLTLNVFTISNLISTKCLVLKARGFSLNITCSVGME